MRRRWRRDGVPTRLLLPLALGSLGVSHHVWHRASPALVGHEHEHVHSQGLVDPSIVRSRAGVKAVAISLGVLGATAAVQAVIFVLTGSVALLADLIHNAGDASLRYRSVPPFYCAANVRRDGPATPSCSPSSGRS